jgi:transcriptional regulator with XRE-family HTH domain
VTKTGEFKKVQGNRIRELRKKKNIKIPFILEKLDISRSTLTGWETGRRAPKGEYLVKLANLLDTSVDYLTGKSDTEEFPEESEIDRILKAKNLTYNGSPISNEKEEALKNVIRALLNG